MGLRAGAWFRTEFFGFARGGTSPAVPYRRECRLARLSSFHPRSNFNLLSVEVCLDPNNKGDPTAINCPGARADVLGQQPGVVECSGNIWMRLGIEVRTLATQRSHCRVPMQASMAARGCGCGVWSGQGQNLQRQEHCMPTKDPVVPLVICCSGPQVHVQVAHAALRLCARPALRLPGGGCAGSGPACHGFRGALTWQARQCARLLAWDAWGCDTGSPPKHPHHCATVTPAASSASNSPLPCPACRPSTAPTGPSSPGAMKELPVY